MKCSAAVVLVFNCALVAHAIHELVGTAPTFNFEQDDVIVYQTNADGSLSNLVLQCDVTGNPTPTVTWFREDAPVDSSLVQSDGSFVYPNIIEGKFASTAGVVYRCEANNTIGNPAFPARVRSRDITVTYAFFGGFTVSGETFVPSTIGTDIALECNVRESQPPPTFVWYDVTAGQPETLLVEDTGSNNLRFLENGRFVYIRNLQMFPRHYQCKVTNVNISQTERSTEVFVVNGNGTGLNNHVFKTIGNLSALVGTQNFEFSYVATMGTNDLVCSFFLNDEEVSPLAAIGTNTNPLTLPAAGENPVTLSCRFAADTISTGTLNINERVIIPIPRTHTREVIEGRASDQSIAFDCAALRGYPTPSIVWYYNGVVIDSSLSGRSIMGGNGEMLVIATPEVSHSGVYQCVVSNPVSELRVYWVLEVRSPVVPDPLPFDLMVNNAVLDRQTGTLVVRDLFTAVTVTTMVQADPCPTVQWSFNGTDIANGGVYTIDNPCSVINAPSPFVFTLTVRNLTSAQSGLYSATFTNFAGPGTLPCLYITIPEPVINAVPSLELTVVGNSEAQCLLNASDVLITCNTQGFPRPAVEFTRDGFVITPGTAQFSRYSLESSYIDQLRLNDVNSGDGGRFQCRVPGGSNESVLVDFEFCTMPMVTFSSVMPDNIVKGQKLRVQCEIVGTPMPQVQWFINGVMVDDTEDSIEITSPQSNPSLSQLTIEPVAKSNDGTYRCVGTNNAGSASQTITVTVNELSFMSSALSTESIIGLAIGSPGLTVLIILLILLACLVLQLRRKALEKPMISQNVNPAYDLSSGEAATHIEKVYDTVVDYEPVDNQKIYANF